MQRKHAFSTLQVKVREGVYDSTHVMFSSVTSLRTMSGGIYVLSLLVDDTMSNPSNIKSSGGASRLVRKCPGIKHVSLGALLSSSLSSLSVVVYAGVGAGVGVGGGFQ